MSTFFWNCDLCKNPNLVVASKYGGSVDSRGCLKPSSALDVHCTDDLVTGKARGSRT